MNSGSASNSRADATRNRATSLDSQDSPTFTYKPAYDQELPKVSPLVLFELLFAPYFVYIRQEPY
jgi:hypothetical protein